MQKAPTPKPPQQPPKMLKNHQPLQPNPPPHLRPLQRHRASLHMATTLSALLSLPSAWQNLKNVSRNSSYGSLARLSELSAAHADLAPYLTREMLLRARSFMDGVNLYRNHPVRRGPETAPVIWRSGTTCLRDYAPQNPKAPTVLVVPSLINRFSILDLEPNHSFIRFLAAQGLRPLVVDWDSPSTEEKDFALDDYVMKRLLPALQIASADQPTHLIGYCMGGALTLALAQLQPERIRSLVLLATPWDFHAGYQAAGQNGALLEQKLQAWLKGNDYLPVEVVQSVFTAFQPLHAFRKFAAFAGYDQTGPEALRFVLTEDWLNDGVPLTAPAARECYGDWSARNVMQKGLWRIGGQFIDPRKILCPAYVLVPGKDRIVPPQSAMPLAHALPKAVRHEPMMGHIGIMASPTAILQVWKPLTIWLSAH